MKHIKLFENFEVPGVNIDKASIIFDFLPFDDKIDDPINSSVPQEIAIDEVVNYCKSNPDIGKIGLFISHTKLPSGGFVRYITSSTDPLILDSATFDSNFKLVFENKGIDPSDLESHKKGTSMLRRMGIGKKD
jgi:hypothetical protein